MGEDFDGSMNTGVDIASSTDVDASSEISLSESIEPVADIPVEEPVITAELEAPISGQELAELQNEAEALDIQPFEDIETEPLDPVQEINIDYDAVFEGLDEYDFDGKDFNQNSEQLNGLLDGFTGDNWSTIDLDGQKERITGLFDYVNDVLNLENPPNIEYYNEAEQGNYGGYNPVTNTLSINEYMLYDSNEAADTVAHELWHAYQHERASNPQSPKDFQYQAGFENYIRPGDDFDGYQSQLVEAEARAFADQFKGAIAQMGRA